MSLKGNIKALACALLFSMLAGLANRPAGAIVYHGFPHLHLTMALVEAGGGAPHFSAYRLAQRLAGAQAGAENAALVRRFGATRVRSFYAVYTFAVTDALKRAHNLLIPLPASGRPNPHDARALATALYRAGITPGGRYDVGYMLEMLMSHQIHHTIMGDMDARFTPAVNASFHVILTAQINDLKREYGLSAR